MMNVAPVRQSLDFRGRVRAAWLIAVAATLLPGVALAHTEEGVAGGLLSGFTHPIFGFDHVVAMVAVGLWGDSSGNPRSGCCRWCSPW
jgi:urease accessory protein